MVRQTVHKKKKESEKLESEVFVDSFARRDSLPGKPPMVFHRKILLSLPSELGRWVLYYRTALIMEKIHQNLKGRILHLWRPVKQWRVERFG